MDNKYKSGAWNLVDVCPKCNNQTNYHNDLDSSICVKCGYDMSKPILIHLVASSDGKMYEINGVTGEIIEI